MLDEPLLVRLLVSRGLVPQERLRALLAARAPGEPRPLEDLLVAARVVAPEAMEQVRREILASFRGTPPEPAETKAGADRASPPTIVDAARRPRVGAERGFQKGDPIPLRPGLTVTCEGVLGEGGMGIVYLVRDPRLGRLAALKLIKGQARAGRVRRFRREIVITARLDHPGIPPVYESGATSSDQDYLLMRAVDGRSLAKLIERRTKLDREPRDLLQGLVKVAEAVAYAHSKGVIHRDLKPDNLMIGAYGEVLVMDWGLARDLGQSRAEDEAVQVELAHASGAHGPGAHARTDATLLEGTQGLTLEGALLGTLGFMAPEQARREDVGPPADVFALGAVLACVLTGDPPIVGDTAIAILERTANGTIELPRSRRRGVAPELDAIAAKAMSLDPAQRYGGASAFAEDLRAYLEGRPVSVHRYGPIAQTVRLARRHPAAFASLAVAGALGVVGAVVVGRARAEAVAAERRAAVDAARAEALAARARFEAPGASSSDSTTTAALEVRAGGALAALAATQRWHALAPSEAAAARARFDAALALGGLAQATEQWALAAEAYRDAAHLGVDDARAAALALGVETARTAETRRRRDEVQGLLDRAASGELAEVPDGVQDAVYRIVRYPDPEIHALLVARLGAATDELARVLLAYLGEAERPTEDEAAGGAGRIARLPEAIDALSRELDPGPTFDPALKGALVEAQGRLELRALVANLAEGHLRRRGFLDLAGDRQARALGARLDEVRLCCEGLGRSGGDRAVAIRALSAYLSAEGDEQRAVAAGLALCRLGGEQAARALHRAQLRFGWSGPFSDQVSRLSPLLRDAVRALAGGDVPQLVERGNMRAVQGDLDGALEDYTRALELDPENVTALSNRGTAYQRLGKLAEALRDLDRATSRPGATADTFANRARARHDSGDFEGALEDAARALERDVGLGMAWSQRGLTRWRLGDMKGAREDLDRAVDVEPRQPVVWLHRAFVRAELGDHPGAVADLSEALKLDARMPEAWSARGVQRGLAGDALGGIEDLTRAIQLAPRDPGYWYNRATIETRIGRLDAALGDYDRAIELDPKSPAAWTNRGDLRHRRGELKEAVADLDRALALDPRDVIATSNRGAIRLALGDEGGWADMRRAADLAPTEPMARYRLAQACFQHGRYAEACDHFDGVLALAPDHTAWRLGRAWSRLLAGRREGALEDLRLVAVDPSLPKAAVWLAALGQRVAGLEAAARGEPPLRDVALFYLGRLDEQGLLSAADAVTNADLRRATRCVARAHLGIAAEARGDAAAAATHYRAAVEEGVHDMVEGRWAKGRLASE